jgi:hypothetical protein
MINQNLLLTGDDGGYNLTKSLRFRASASASLSRTPTTSGNRRTFTFSAWVKFGTIGTTNRVLMSSVLDSDNRYQMQISDATADQLTFQARLSGVESKYFTTNAVYRDPAAWYHIVYSIDTTQATGSDRIKVYVNGVQQSGSNPSTIAQNTETFFNAAIQQNIGNVVSAAFFDGYMTEINFIDGQALTPSSFGSTNALTGVWQPAKYTGTYGTNGFYLPFTNTTSTSTLGNDFSGNSNTWTVNNISLTAGSTYDSMTDVPTLTSTTAANYATLSPLQKNPNITPTNGNLRLVANNASWRAVGSTIFMITGKWYCEMTVTTIGDTAFGLYSLADGVGSVIWTDNNFAGRTGTTGGSYLNSGNKISGGSSSAYGASFTTGDVIACAYDADAGTVVFYKNNTSQGTAFTGFTGGYAFTLAVETGAGTTDLAINFGQQPFVYTAPANHLALNTFNL